MKNEMLTVISWLFLLGSCASKPHATTESAWTDATLVAEQRAVIEQQQSTLADMESLIESVRGNLKSARDDFARASEQATDLREQFAVIDAFVREIIAAERHIEEFQQSNLREDAGAR